MIKRNQSYLEVLGNDGSPKGEVCFSCNPVNVLIYITYSHLSTMFNT